MCVIISLVFGEHVLSTNTVRFRVVYASKNRYISSFASHITVLRIIATWFHESTLTDNEQYVSLLINVDQNTTVNCDFILARGSF